MITTMIREARITAILEPASAPALLRLLHLCSPALPIGTFAYSQGLEPAVAAGWVTTEDDARAWIVGQIGAQLATLDLPILMRLHSAWGEDDARAAHAWSAVLTASRPSAELQTEDRQLGAALARLLAGLGLADAEPWVNESRGLNRGGRADVTLAAMFALAARRWDIPATLAAHGYAFAWAEAQTSAAVRVVPLGQSAGQRILVAAAAAIPAAVARALTMADDDLGAAAPRLAIASAHHETQYSRLFRS
jgi:urease accessory protein